MRTVLVVSGNEELRARLLRSLNGGSVFSAGTDDEGLRTLRVTEVELIVKEATRPVREVAAFVSRARQLCPAAVVVCVVPADQTSMDDEAAMESADYVLLQPFTSRHLQGVLRQAEEKLRLLQEVAALRASRRPEPVPVLAAEATGSGEEGPSQVVKEFAKALSAGFDLQRVLGLFLDAVAEMTQPSKSAILTPDQAGRTYRIVAQHGLAPHLVESVSLLADAGLPVRLGHEGRPIHIEEAQANPTDAAARQVARELGLLQAVMVGAAALARRAGGHPDVGAARDRWPLQPARDEVLSRANDGALPYRWCMGRISANSFREMQPHCNESLAEELSGVLADGARADQLSTTACTCASPASGAIRALLLESYVNLRGRFRRQPPRQHSRATGSQDTAAHHRTGIGCHQRGETRV